MRTDCHHVQGMISMEGGTKSSDSLLIVDCMFRQLRGRRVTTCDPESTKLTCRRRLQLSAR